MRVKIAGGYFRGVRARLKKAGKSSEEIEELMAVIAGNNNGSKLVKIPRATIKKISMMLTETRRAVVVIGKRGFKVYSLDGYQNSVKWPTENKPWLSKKDLNGKQVVAAA